MLSSSQSAAGDAAAAEVLRELVRRGLAEAEVLTKRGRSRRLALELGTEISAFSQERAWAVRASSRRASFFAAGAGDLPAGEGDVPGSPGGTWPEATGRPFRLPDPEAIPPWTQPSDIEAPLIGESEGLRLLAGEPDRGAQGTLCLGLGFSQRGDINRAKAIVGVDVPRVPAARVVIVKLEHVARPAQHLAAGFLVPDRGDDAIVVELDPKEFVLHGSIRVGRPS